MLGILNFDLVFKQELSVSNLVKLEAFFKSRNLRGFVMENLKKAGLVAFLALARLRLLGKNQNPEVFLLVGELELLICIPSLLFKISPI